MKTVINILPHVPAYEMYENHARPAANWDTPSGSWVGVWGGDWPDQLGFEIRKIEPKIRYEVWQPDLRADKVYAHRLEGEVVHKLFPARPLKKMHGLRVRQWAWSDQLMEQLLQVGRGNDVIIHLNYSRGHFENRILDSELSAPLVIEFHGELSFPANELTTPTKNILSKLNLLSEHKRLRWRLARASAIIYKSTYNLAALRRVYVGPLSQITLGVDFDFWTPGSRVEARRTLGIREDQRVLLSVSRLTDLKQTHRLIEVLAKVRSENEWILFIVGTGDRNYEQRLRQQVALTPNPSRFHFAGYVKGEELRTYYRASDVFVMSSRSEGGPVTSMEAIACGVPVLSTDTGYVAELMKQHRAGIVFSRNDYSQWEEQVKRIICNGDVPQPLPRDLAAEYFHWPLVAGRYFELYRSMDLNRHKLAYA
jgi:glycosyltransferase involved in cell wall biosynthesis